MEVLTQTVDASHERWQEPSHEEQWSDSFYFGGGDGAGLAFYSRIGRRPNEGTVEGAIGIWLPGQGFLLSFARGAPGPELECGPLRFDCLAPLLLWELRLAGQGRLFERAEHVGTARDRYRTVDLEGVLRFSAWHEPLSFGSGLAAGVATAHYEQPGSVAGVIAVDGRRSAFSGRGLRDHSWGVRDWQRVPYWRWFGMVVDPDTYVLVNNVGLADGGETTGGFLMEGGVLAPVVACETESELDPELGAQRSFVARARDERGREAILTGEALEVAPLRQRRGGRTTFVNEALTRYTWDGRTATGISEYLIQQEEPGEDEAAGRSRQPRQATTGAPDG